MIEQSIRGVLVRELETLAREIEAYPDDSSVWVTPEGIRNSAGTLALHLAGNLQHFIGTHLGDSDYRRDREGEFSRTNLSRDELVRIVRQAIATVAESLQQLPSSALAKPFPVLFGGQSVQTGEFLVHLASHLAFHLGQIDYHRRLVTGDHRSVAPLPIPELPTYSGKKSSL